MPVSSPNGNGTSNPHFPATQLRGRPTSPENDLVIDQSEWRAPGARRGGRAGIWASLLHRGVALRVARRSCLVGSGGGQTRRRARGILPGGIGRQETRVDGTCGEEDGKPGILLRPRICGASSMRIWMGSPGNAGGWRGVLPRHHGFGFNAAVQRSASDTESVRGPGCGRHRGSGRKSVVDGVEASRRTAARGSAKPR